MKLMNGETLKLSKDFNGVAYFKFTDNAGNFTVDKTYGFAKDTIKPKIGTVATNVKGIVLTDTKKVKKIKYSTVTSKTLVIDTTATYGSGKKSIEYKIVPSTSTFGKSKWKKFNKKKLALDKNFKGVIYIKFTDKAGNTRTYRTNGFQIKKNFKKQ